MKYGLVDLKAIIGAHKVGAVTVGIVCVPLVNGEPVAIIGQAAKTVENGVPTVVLLTSESNPQFWIENPFAPENFARAVEKSVKTGECFYSIPFRGWEEYPPFRWSVVKEKKGGRRKPKSTFFITRH